MTEADFSWSQTTSKFYSFRRHKDRPLYACVLHLSNGNVSAREAWSWGYSYLISAVPIVIKNYPTYCPDSLISLFIYYTLTLDALSQETMCEAEKGIVWFQTQLGSLTTPGSSTCCILLSGIEPRPLQLRQNSHNHAVSSPWVRRRIPIRKVCHGILSNLETSNREQEGNSWSNC